MRKSFWNKRKNNTKKTLDIGKVITCMALAYTVSLTPAYAEQIITSGITSTTLNTNGTITDVTTTTFKGSNAFNAFTKFNVDAGNTVNLVVPNASDNLINIVTGEQSAINGVLNSIKQGQIGGNIFLVNPFGVVIGTQGVVNVGSITAVTPTQDFINYFFDVSGEPNDASVTALLDGTAPIKQNSYISIFGKINAINNVTLESGDISVPGDIYTNALFGPDINTGDIVNLNTLNYITDPNNLVLNNGEIKILAHRNISPIAIFEDNNVLAAKNIAITAGQKLTLYGAKYFAKENFTLNSGDIVNDGITFSPTEIKAGSINIDFINQNNQIIIDSNSNIYLNNLNNIIVNNQPLIISDIHLRSNDQISLNGEINPSGEINIQAPNISFYDSLNINTNNDIYINSLKYLNLKANIETNGQLTINGGDINQYGINFAPTSIKANSLTSDFLNNSDLNITSNGGVSIGNLDNIIINNNPLSYTNINLVGSSVNLSGNISAQNNINLKSTGVEDNTVCYYFVNTKGNIKAGNNITLESNLYNAIFDSNIEAQNIILKGKYLSIDRSNLNSANDIRINSQEIVTINGTIEATASNSTDNLLVNTNSTIDPTSTIGATIANGIITVNGAFNGNSGTINITAPSITGTGTLKATGGASDVTITNNSTNHLKFNDFAAASTAGNNSIIINGISVTQDFDDITVILEQGSTVGTIDINNNTTSNVLIAGNMTGSTVDIATLGDIQKAGSLIKANDLRLNANNITGYLPLDVATSTNIYTTGDCLISGKTGDLFAISEGKFYYNNVDAGSFFVIAEDQINIDNGTISGDANIISTAPAVNGPAEIMLGHTQDLDITGNLTASTSFGNIYYYGGSVGGDATVISSETFTDRISTALGRYRDLDITGDLYVSSAGHMVYMEGSVGGNATVVADGLAGFFDVDIAGDLTADVMALGYFGGTIGGDININAPYGSLFGVGNLLRVGGNAHFDPSDLLICDTVNIAGNLTHDGASLITLGVLPFYADPTIVIPPTDITQENVDTIFINEINRQAQQMITGGFALGGDLNIAGSEDIFVDGNIDGTITATAEDIFLQEQDNVDIANITGNNSVDLTSVNGDIVNANPVDNAIIITTKDLNLTANNGSIGTIDDFINVELTASTLDASAKDDIYIDVKKGNAEIGVMQSDNTINLSVREGKITDGNGDNYNIITDIARIKTGNSDYASIDLDLNLSGSGIIGGYGSVDISGNLGSSQIVSMGTLTAHDINAEQLFLAGYNGVIADNIIASTNENEGILELFTGPNNATVTATDIKADNLLINANGNVSLTNFSNANPNNFSKLYARSANGNISINQATTGNIVQLEGNDISISMLNHTGDISVRGFDTVIVGTDISGKIYIDANTVVLNSQNDINVELINATESVDLYTSNGDILDANNQIINDIEEANIITKNVILEATNGSIGTIDDDIDVELTASSINARALENIYIDINKGNANVGLISAGNNIRLRVKEGNLTDANGEDPNIVSYNASIWVGESANAGLDLDFNITNSLYIDGYGNSKISGHINNAEIIINGNLEAKNITGKSLDLTANKNLIAENIFLNDTENKAKLYLRTNEEWVRATNIEANYLFVDAFSHIYITNYSNDDTTAFNSGIALYSDYGDIFVDTVDTNNLFRAYGSELVSIENMSHNGYFDIEGRDVWIDGDINGTVNMDAAFIQLSNERDINIKTITAGNVNLISNSGNILDANDQLIDDKEVANIIAENVVLTSYGSIGTIDDDINIELTASRLDATAMDGINITIDEGNVDVGSINAYESDIIFNVNNGDITGLNTGKANITAGDATIIASGNIDLSFNILGELILASDKNINVTGSINQGIIMANETLTAEYVTGKDLYFGAMGNINADNIRVSTPNGSDFLEFLSGYGDINLTNIESGYMYLSTHADVNAVNINITDIGPDAGLIVYADEGNTTLNQLISNGTLAINSEDVILNNIAHTGKIDVKCTNLTANNLLQKGAADSTIETRENYKPAYLEPDGNVNLTDVHFEGNVNIDTTASFNGINLVVDNELILQSQGDINLSGALNEATIMSNGILTIDNLTGQNLYLAAFDTINADTIIVTTPDNTDFLELLTATGDINLKNSESGYTYLSSAKDINISNLTVNDIGEDTGLIALARSGNTTINTVISNGALGVNSQNITLDHIAHTGRINLKGNNITATEVVQKGPSDLKMKANGNLILKDTYFNGTLYIETNGSFNGENINISPDGTISNWALQNNFDASSPGSIIANSDGKITINNAVFSNTDINSTDNDVLITNTNSVINATGKNITLTNNDDILLGNINATKDLYVTSNKGSLSQIANTTITGSNATLKAKNSIGTNRNYFSASLTGTTDILTGYNIYFTETQGDLYATKIISEYGSAYIVASAGDARIEHISAAGTIDVQAKNNVYIKEIDPTNIIIKVLDSGNIDITTGLVSNSVTLQADTINANFKNTSTGPIAYSLSGVNNGIANAIKLTSTDDINITNLNTKTIDVSTSANNLSVTNAIVTDGGRFANNSKVATVDNIGGIDPSGSDVVLHTSGLFNLNLNDTNVINTDSFTLVIAPGIKVEGSDNRTPEINNDIAMINNEANKYLTDNAEDKKKKELREKHVKAEVASLSNPEMYLQEEYRNYTILILQKADNVYKMALNNNKSKEDALSDAANFLLNANFNADVSKKIMKNEQIETNQDYVNILNKLISSETLNISLK